MQKNGSDFFENLQFHFPSKLYKLCTESDVDCSYSFILNVSLKGMLMSLMRSKLKSKHVGLSIYCLTLQRVCFMFVVLFVALFPHIFAPQYDIMLVYCCPHCVIFYLSCFNFTVLVIFLVDVIFPLLLAQCLALSLCFYSCLMAKPCQLPYLHP